jgi:hypothetical protein
VPPFRDVENERVRVITDVVIGEVVVDGFFKETREDVDVERLGSVDENDESEAVEEERDLEDKTRSISFNSSSLSSI